MDVICTFNIIISDVIINYILFLVTVRKPYTSFEKCDAYIHITNIVNNIHCDDTLDE